MRKEYRRPTISYDAEGSRQYRITKEALKRFEGQRMTLELGDKIKAAVLEAIAPTLPQYDTDAIIVTRDPQDENRVIVSLPPELAAMTTEDCMKANEDCWKSVREISTRVIYEVAPDHTNPSMTDRDILCIARALLTLKERMDKALEENKL